MMISFHWINGRRISPHPHPVIAAYGADSFTFTFGRKINKNMVYDEYGGLSIH